MYPITFCRVLLWIYAYNIAASVYKHNRMFCKVIEACICLNIVLCVCSAILFCYRVCFTVSLDFVSWLIRYSWKNFLQNTLLLLDCNYFIHILYCINMFVLYWTYWVYVLSFVCNFNKDTQCVVSSTNINKYCIFLYPS